MLLVAFIGYLAAAWATDAPKLIEVMNGVVMALACGVMVAYAKPAWEALASDRPTAGEMLGLGVFFSWLGVVLQRGVSIMTRNFDQAWVVDSDIVTLFLFCAMIAGTLHLVAPQAIEGDIPPRTWVRFGVLVAGGLCLFFLFSYFSSH